MILLLYKKLGVKLNQRGNWLILQQCKSPTKNCFLEIAGSSNELQMCSHKTHINNFQEGKTAFREGSSVLFHLIQSCKIPLSPQICAANGKFEEFPRIRTMSQMLNMILNDRNNY